MWYDRHDAASKRSFLRSLGVSASLLVVGNLWPVQSSWAKQYLTISQAKSILLPNVSLTPMPVELTKAEQKSIAAASKTRVRSPLLQAWKGDSGEWFIVDQIIGKHENIDMAFALDNQGAMIGLEILTYRESYGHEIRHPKWRAQFHGRKHTEHLKLERQIKNISGATLSCRHVTDGINRLMHTWDQVLRNR